MGNLADLADQAKALKQKTEETVNEFRERLDSFDDRLVSIETQLIGMDAKLDQLLKGNQNG